MDIPILQRFYAFVARQLGENLTRTLGHFFSTFFTALVASLLLLHKVPADRDAIVALLSGAATVAFRTLFPGFYPSPSKDQTPNLPIGH